MPKPTVPCPDSPAQPPDDHSSALAASDLGLLCRLTDHVVVSLASSRLSADGRRAYISIGHVQNPAVLDDIAGQLLWHRLVWVGVVAAWNTEAAS